MEVPQLARGFDQSFVARINFDEIFAFLRFAPEFLKKRHGVIFDLGCENGLAEQGVVAVSVFEANQAVVAQKLKRLAQFRGAMIVLRGKVRKRSGGKGAQFSK